jgi:selenocysteine-specific translation elongation factor
VRFVLALEDTGNRRASEHADRAREMERERQDVQAEAETVEAQVRNLQQRVEIGTASALDVRPLQDRYASLQRRLRDMTVSAESASLSGRSIIDSSFTMDAGETVVVGTSKLGGDKALIALVTAVRKSGQGQGRN